MMTAGGAVVPFLAGVARLVALRRSRVGAGA